MRGALAAAGLVLVCGVAACSTVDVQPPTPTALPTATATAPPPTDTPMPSPTPSVAPPSPTPSAAPATATPVAPLALRISAQLDPPTPRAGEEFVLALSVSNDGTRPARGLYIATNGPWDRWTVLGVEPDGSFGQDDAGWHIISGVETPPGETRTILVHIRADQPAQEQLTFAVREATPDELPPP